MSITNWFRPPRQLLAMFIGTTLVSAAALGWLSWELVRQDRALAVQRAQEQRDSAAGLAVATLEKRLSDIEERLSFLASMSADDVTSDAAEFSHGLTTDSVLLILKSDEMEAHPAGHLLYHPVLPRPREAPADVFAQAEIAEFQGKSYAAAVAALAETSRASDPLVRVEALVRLGRNHRNAGRWPDAMAVYDELRQMRNATVRGVPADLLARAARCNILEELQEEDRLRTEASSLYADLHHGKWRLTRPVYDVYAAQMRRVPGVELAPAAAPHAVALAEAVHTIWQERKENKLASVRQTLRLGDHSMLVLTRHATDRTIAVVLGANYLASRWLPELQSIAQTHHARIALADRDGQPVIGHLDRADQGASLRAASATGLPWSVHAMSIHPGGARDAFSVRGRLVMAGLFAIAVLVLGGSYLIARAVARELAVARLQSDFVTAVSHEFRTPLTALRQLSELLAKGRVPNEGVRQQYYEVLEHESARLHRLVEGLLNFGRMQAGAMRYHFETIDAAALLRSVVEEFRVQARRHDCRIEFNANGTVAPMRADREALGCVVWNLLDNAVKYSPDNRTVWLELGHENGCVAIRVRDQGVGIPREEQARIFQKFVRGQVASHLGVQGAGIGLAVAREIIATHGGEIKIDSTPGTGSTFTVLLPAAK